SFDEIEHRVTGFEIEWLSTRHEKCLSSRITVRPFSDGNQRQVFDAESAERIACGIELAHTAVNQQKVRPGRLSRLVTCYACRLIALWCLAEQSFEPPCQHFAHHAVVIARHELRRTYVELAILVFLKSLGAGDNHRAD